MQAVKKHFPYILIVIILIFAGGVSWYFYNQYQAAKNPTLAAQQEVKQLVAKLNTVMELPAEQPTVATVSDKTKLANQSFFAKAENGDKVIIYASAKKAILYRPATGKIIEVSPINVNPVKQPVPTVSPNQAFKIAFYNGTTTSGLTTLAEKQLRTKFSSATVVSKENASKNDYAETVVVDVSGKNSALAESIAQMFKGKVSSLPPGEVSAQSDILVILGKSYVSVPSVTVPPVQPSPSQ